MMGRWCIGLDLGQASDYSAAAIIREQAATEDTPLRHEVPWLQRWELGTSYPTIVRQATALVRRTAAALGPLGALVVDYTGCGRPVVDYFRLEELPVPLYAATITGGRSATLDHDSNDWHIPKIQLVSAVQLMLQDGRLQIARALADAATLSAELLNFQVKVTTSANEQYGAWREGTHDDLVLAVALPCWALLAGATGGPVGYAVGGERLPAGFDARIEGGRRQPDPRKAGRR
jgi:hypothetical protein